MLIVYYNFPFSLITDFKNEHFSKFYYTDDIDDDPEVSPGLFEGDIAGLSQDVIVRLGIDFQVFPERKWTNAIVPYEISSKYCKFSLIYKGN
ncbi:hypothetical protein Avbf_01102 [Armadillidium vulgare]|nr:hypothetical protein Avbf_01102 [Armadillidium vulgare]